MRVGIYARVSTRDKGQNPEMQLEPCRRYCAAMSWETYREYVDLVSAGDLTNRTAWAQLMKDASLRKFDILLIWKLDRAFRSMVHASTTLQTLNGYGIGFRSLMDAAIDTTTPNGMLVFNILASVAQFEKDLITLRIKEGVNYAQEHGTRSGKPIGRRRYDISLQTICKVVSDTGGNYSEAARRLTEQYHTKLTAGFISTRVKRSGNTKESIMAGVNR